MRNKTNEPVFGRLLVWVIPVIALVMAIIGAMAVSQTKRQQAAYQSAQQQYQRAVMTHNTAQTVDSQVAQRRAEYVARGKAKTKKLVTSLNATDYLSHGGDFNQQIKDLKQRKQSIKGYFKANGAGIDFSRFPSDQITVSYGAVRGTTLPVFLSGGSPIRKVAHVVNKYGVELSYDLIDEKFSDQVAYQVNGGE
ncbi:hypothetical protein JK167_13300 [Levilactobacillus brevis]|uniref:Uncharacterized protein n=1 Tax=Levilactobacillus brevis TaxID=1580 RepID=A0AA41JU72_LEVBR|nr:hypothetical protein [Levilactobacillus brevis]MBS0948616.1 hypothetical protein [Levilactobacillus brevis]MBS1011782.1 hypothetical protein [Levilactobacillus brevis]